MIVIAFEVSISADRNISRQESADNIYSRTRIFRRIVTLFYEKCEVKLVNEQHIVNSAPQLVDYLNSRGS